MRGSTASASVAGVFYYSACWPLTVASALQVGADWNVKGRHSKGWVRGYWRTDGTRVDAHLRNNVSDDMAPDSKLRVVASWMDKGFKKTDLSGEYQELWESAKAFIERGLKSEREASLPPGGKWISKNLYEENGVHYLRPNHWTKPFDFKSQQSLAQCCDLGSQLRILSLYFPSTYSIDCIRHFEIYN